LEYLLVGDGKTDLYISKIILDQLVLLYSQDDQKIMNNAKDSFVTSVKYIENKKIKSIELIEKMREYKKYVKSVLKDNPDIKIIVPKK
jgi:predicted RecB family endonuclease